METVYCKRENNLEYTWKIEYPRETVAGILAGAIYITSRDEIKDIYIDSDGDFSDYLIHENITEDDIPYKSYGVLGDKEYGIWCRSYIPYKYNLYKFKTAKFMQGLISIANNFNVDFRRCIYGMIFDQTGEQYSLRNYVMSEPLLMQDAPDLDDIEEEEKDDENIIERLRKDY